MESARRLGNRTETETAKPRCIASHSRRAWILMRAVSGAACVAALAWWATACTQSKAQADVATALKGVAPFDSLVGVRLGMSPQQLLRQRPRAKREPYIGYMEQVADRVVKFQVSGSHERDQDANGRLEAVEVTTTFPSSVEAERAFRQRIPEITKQFQVPAHCFRLAAHWGWTASLWRVPGGTLHLISRGFSALPSQAPSVAEVPQSGSVALGIARDDIPPFNKMNRETAIECP